VHAGVSAVPQTLNLVLHQQFFPFEFYDFEVIDRGMGQAIVDFLFERLVLFFKFHKMRLHRHAACLLNQWLPDEISLAQTRDKGDVTPAFAPQQIAPEAFDWRWYFCPLERPCGKRDNYWAFAKTDDRAESKPAVAMTHEDERALREQLARLQQEHRDLDAAIAALATSPGSDLIQVQRLKKRKLVLRDKIRQIEDALTPDIIA
jgi:hypothetical protein